MTLQWLENATSHNGFSYFQLGQDEYEFHHAGFKTPFVHNLSDLVQANLGTQVCTVQVLVLCLSHVKWDALEMGFFLSLWCWWCQYYLLCPG